MAAPPMTRPRFALLIDGSRSMSASASTALQIAVALASVTPRVEVFTFSTALERVTADVRARRAASDADSRPAGRLGRRHEHRRVPSAIRASVLASGC